MVNRQYPRRAAAEPLTEDAAAIPAHLMRSPPPAPDRTAIGKLLRAGVTVQGARLIENHDPVAIFRSNHR
jgi:hypothetical protein